jgi:cytochrome c-type biogenesis protein CcmF
VILTFFIGGSLTLYVWRASTLKAGGLFAPVSREGALVLNNIFLSAACATVLVGTLYPLVLETLTNQKISVGPHYFNSTFAPLTLLLVLAIPFGPLLAWKRGDFYWAVQRVFAAIGLGLCVCLMIGVVMQGPVIAVVGSGLAAYAMLGAFAEMGERTKLFRVPVSDSIRRACKLPGAMWASTFGHLGVGVMVLGIMSATSWNIEHMDTMKTGQTMTVGTYSLYLQRLESRKGPNYSEAVAVFDMRRGGVKVGDVETSKRFYTARQMSVTEAGLATFGLSQLYVSLGEILEGGQAIAVRAEWKPLVLLIWIGPVIMALGGIMSLGDRRLRIGAPRRREKSA